MSHRTFYADKTPRKRSKRDRSSLTGIGLNCLASEALDDALADNLRGQKRYLSEVKSASFLENSRARTQSLKLAC